ncbi:GroES-like protein [Mytilinidion resinicola]|uniref:GroES-like protein n=1 Tax=Mytilinidion resinicola TaxID=574789 RepID=A0A6A6Z0K6_9PEZI|nr:GroES-like protein [Mytilinidion resinicola]KAF2814621.1 GroES-like protein [Mytilinidion resinicola]
MNVDKDDPSMKRHISVVQSDGLDNLTMAEGEMPVPPEDEVLVEVLTVSLNYRDTEVVMSLYTHHQSANSPTALVPCSDMCGVVLAVGPSSSPSPLKVGDRVVSTFAPKHLTGQVNAEMLGFGLGGPNPGVLTTHRVFPTYGLLKVPEYLTDEEVCTLPIASMTAWMSINGMRPMGQTGGKGEVVLLQGTGGVSIAGLQIANAAGAIAKALGATHTINYTTTPKWEQEVLKLTFDYGADIIFKLGGARTLRKSFDCVAFGEDDPGDRLNTNVLALRRNVTLGGILNGPKDRFEEMLGFYEEHGIRPAVDKVFPFEESKIALKNLFGGGHFGKVIVRVKE